jgi:hypothetical protein
VTTQWKGLLNPEAGGTPRSVLGRTDSGAAVHPALFLTGGASSDPFENAERWACDYIGQARYGMHIFLNDVGGEPVRALGIVPADTLEHRRNGLIQSRRAVDLSCPVVTYHTLFECSYLWLRTHLCGPVMLCAHDRR